MENTDFILTSTYSPSGDQPGAIDQIVKNINNGLTDTVLLGVTGSGKTYTVANVIQKVQRPTLIISHNKTLAGQLYQEFRDFFPKNAVEYFVSYYDYYQPESYIPSTDTYIEKEADRNEEIDKLRLSATTSLSTRRDVIVVASVSCIYNLGNPVEYQKNILEVMSGMRLRRNDLLVRLTDIQYTRNDFDLKRSTYRVSGDVVDIVPSYEEVIIRLEFLEDKLVNISKLDYITGKLIEPLKYFTLYPAKHYITELSRRDEGIKAIKSDLKKQVDALKAQNKIVEAYRLEQRTMHDIEMINEIGYTGGIENYSRYFDGRKPGEAPFTLLDFFPKDYLLVIDESHITVPQIRGMFNGDRSRKQTLVDYGFRLPSALDNRPLMFEEFLRRKGENTVYTSATPAEYELTLAQGKEKPNTKPVVEMIVRPTGLIDPTIDIRPVDGQVTDLINEIEKTIAKKQRVLVTTLTKRMAEELTSYLEEKKLKVAYLHSDIETLERSDILDKLRRGNYDVLIGINLLREGLDLPEVSLVAVLDADKEGFLRSQSSLIQTMGRAARHKDGRVILYANTVTKSIKAAVDEVERRREIQLAYNKKHNIAPQSIQKPFREVIIEREIIEEPDYTSSVVKSGNKKQSDAMQLEDFEFKTMGKKEQTQVIKHLEHYMKKLAGDMEFEKAAIVRDKVLELKRSK